jgi:hypothetical protein
MKNWFNTLPAYHRLALAPVLMRQDAQPLGVKPEAAAGPEAGGFLSKKTPPKRQGLKYRAGPCVPSYGAEFYYYYYLSPNHRGKVFSD